jgi:hypothetical protein
VLPIKPATAVEDQILLRSGGGGGGGGGGSSSSSSNSISNAGGLCRLNQATHHKPGSTVLWIPKTTPPPPHDKSVPHNNLSKDLKWRTNFYIGSLDSKHVRYLEVSSAEGVSRPSTSELFDQILALSAQTTASSARTRVYSASIFTSVVIGGQITCSDELVMWFYIFNLRTST